MILADGPFPRGLVKRHVALDDDLGCGRHFEVYRLAPDQLQRLTEKTTQVSDFVDTVV